MRLACVLLVLASSTATAQVAIKDQPGVKLLEVAAKARAERTPTVAELVALKPEKVPANAQEVLFASDWIDVGAYFYRAKKPVVGYGEPATIQHTIMRILPEGWRIDIACQTAENGGPRCTHTTFTNPPVVKLRVAIKNGAGYLSTTAHGQTDYQRIVRLRDGVMVVDYTISGRMTDKKVSFRSVYIAIPRLFTWTLDEVPPPVK